MAVYLLVLVTFVHLCSGGSVAEKRKIMEYINSWNWDVQCWGEDNVANHRQKLYEICEECSNQPMLDMSSLPAAALQTRSYTPHKMSGMKAQPTMYQPLVYSLPQHGHAWTSLGTPMYHLRGKRSIDSEEMLEEFNSYQEDMMCKISNLTCVLVNMGIMDKDTLQINMQMFSEDMFSQMDLSQGMAADPEWRNKLIECWNTCHSVAQAMPEEAFKGNPMMEAFGRQKVFMKCAMKAKKKMCLAGQALKMLEKFHPEAQISIEGKDKYETAAMAAFVMQHAKTQEMAFIEEFMYGADNDQMP